MDFLFVSLCLQNNLLFALHLIQLPAWIISSFSILFPLLPLHPGFSLPDASEKTCVPNGGGSWSYILCQQCGLRDLSVEMVPFVALWIHEIPLFKHTSLLEPCCCQQVRLCVFFFARHGRVQMHF